MRNSTLLAYHSRTICPSCTARAGKALIVRHKWENEDYGRYIDRGRSNLHGLVGRTTLRIKYPVLPLDCVFEICESFWPLISDEWYHNRGRICGLPACLTYCAGRHYITVRRPRKQRHVFEW